MKVLKYQTTADLAMMHLDDEQEEIVLRADVKKLSRNTYELLEQMNEAVEMLKESKRVADMVGDLLSIEGIGDCDEAIQLDNIWAGISVWLTKIESK